MRRPLPPPPPLPEIPATPARVYTPRPEKRPFAAEAAKHTTALVGIGHVGTRDATDVVLQFQAELAVAHAAVGTLLAEDWATQQGFVGVKSRVSDHREFLLRPDLGRCLDEESLQIVRSTCTRGPDVQIIVADGLSAVPCIGSGKELYDAVARAVVRWAGERSPAAAGDPGRGPRAAPHD